jgi:hypothetical protein
MSQSKILDPFKPAQPVIPGVATPKEEVSKSGEVDENRRPANFIGQYRAFINTLFQLKQLWIGLTMAGALAAIFVLFVLKRQPLSATPPPGPAPGIATVDPLIQDEPVIDAKWAVGPGAIATTAQLSKTWSAKRFYFRDPITSKPAPAIVVHLPGGSFWAFSLQEPFGKCELEYVTDLRKLRTSYGFDAAYPMVADPCNGSVYDLTHYGNAPSGLVRGEVEKGSAWRPPLAIEIRVQGNQVIAVGMER